VLETLPYWQCRDAFFRLETLSTYELELLQRFQRLRNALVHFGVEINAAQVVVEAAHFALKPLQRVVFGTDPHNGMPVPGQRREYLDPENLQRLTRFEPYVAEAVDDAHDSPDCDAVERCWWCTNHTMGVRADDVLYCFCCGEVTDKDAAGWADCNICGQPRAVAFDRLNNHRNLHHGKCLVCGEIQKIFSLPRLRPDTPARPRHRLGRAQGLRRVQRGRAIHLSSRSSQKTEKELSNVRHAHS
jgi:hypothetical protein